MTTPVASVTAAVRQRLNANWTTTPIAWENVPFDPKTPGGIFPADGPWIYCEIVFAGSAQASLGSPGSNRFRHVGLIFIHIFVPVNGGTKKAYEYADQLADIFRAQEFSGVLCRSPVIGRGEKSDDDGNWFRVTLSCEFQFDLTA